LQTLIFWNCCQFQNINYIYIRKVVLHKTITAFIPTVVHNEKNDEIHSKDN